MSLYEINIPFRKVKLLIINTYVMGLKSVIECERNNLQKFKKYQLPNAFKRVGFAITLLCFVGLLFNKFTIESDVWSVLGKYGITFGLLIVSVSKEKIEDELITKIRMTSYSFAFIFAVLWSYVNPFINYAADSIVGKEPAILQQNGDFQILWMLLAIQVMFFHVFKKLS